jgi:hypothetical protein
VNEAGLVKNLEDTDNNVSFNGCKSEVVYVEKAYA